MFGVILLLLLLLWLTNCSGQNNDQIRIISDEIHRIHQQAVLSNKYLRGLYHDEMVKEIVLDIESSYIQIRDAIIITAQRGKTQYKFYVKCAESTTQCGELWRDGHERWLLMHPNDVVNRYIFPLEKYTSVIMRTIHTEFPESNITHTFEKCCNQHTIQW